MHHILFNKKNKTLQFVKEDMVYDELYYGMAIVPNKDQINEYLKNKKADKKILLEFKEFDNDVVAIITHIKDNISKINNKIPLYDEYTKNLHIVNKENVYKSVVYNSYRFPSKELKQILKDRRDKLKPLVNEINNDEHDLSKFDKTQTIYYNDVYKKAAQVREYHKLVLMLNFLKQFNIEILETTYITVFYFYANEVGKDITVCKRPSFMPCYRHIEPYYTRKELINLALNMKLIKPDNKYYDQKEIMKLCKLIRENDITSKTLLDHQEYIIKQNKIGIVRYYSLHGSYFINKYLRDNDETQYQNKILEDVALSMFDLVINAPPFDKSYILYRFVGTDEYLQYLKVGDIHTETSFISTTRNPFYNSAQYRFGFILIKIKIPKDVVGVGLCIETFSDFASEEEIILPPFSQLRLDKKDDNEIYYHYDYERSAKITTKYEFTYLGHKKLKFVEKIPVDNFVVDFLDISQPDTLTIQEKIKIFTDSYVNGINQFDTYIGNKKYTLITETYNSTTVYGSFYEVITSNGFSIYSIFNNYILFFIELAEDNNITSMYVNYYFRKAENGPKIIGDVDFITFLSKVAYYFGVRNVILFAAYTSCDIGKKLDTDTNNGTCGVEVYRGGNYCEDYYKYLKYGEKRFNNKTVNIDSTELKPKFSYYQLDRLKTIDPKTILSRTEQDEIYQIYTKAFLSVVEKDKHNLADFYVWMVENQCVQLNFLLKYMEKIYDFGNPFETDYYVLDAGAFLLNRGIIDIYPTFKVSRVDVDDSKKFPNKNHYRLETDGSNVRGL